MAGLPDALQPLLDPRAYPHPVGAVRLVETPISWVLLTGEFAYKIKRPVLLPFVDLRSAAHRRHLCQEELRLNRRYAPELYLEVCAITRTPDGVRIGGEGEVVETAVRMRQFDRAQELDALVARGDIDAAELARFGAAMAAHHASSPYAHEPGAPGDPERSRARVMRNLAEARHVLASAGIDDDLDELRTALSALQAALHPLFVERWRRGRVRECHGDLHARNVARVSTGLVAFDGLEFEPWFRWIDVGEETAFLFMDLQARGAAPLAHSFLSGYLDASADYGQLQALPVHAADRALVRAKVAALEVRGATEAPARERSLAAAKRYIEVARHHAGCRGRRNRLIVMHGLSGSGKSWLAARLAERLPALHLRSDVLRRHATPPGRTAYSSAATVRTYELLASGAADALAGGLDVIVDATLLRRANRADFRRLAAIHGARLLVVACQAPEATLHARIVDRAARAEDPSEATLAVLDLQRERIEPIVAAEELPVLRVDTTRSDMLDVVVDACEELRSPSTAAPGR